MRRTKIVCTLGPATHSRDAIQELIRAGMDVARLNFSHGTYREHAMSARWVREASKELGRPVALLQDLCGPKIRTGRTPDRRPITLKKGQKLLLTSLNVQGSNQRLSISYAGLARDVRRGNTILLNDGLIQLRVLGTSGRNVETEVIHGGRVGEHKGVNLPGVRLRLESLTRKDEADLRFGLRLGVDYVALSFVRKAADIRRVKALLAREKAQTPVLAKLEKPS